MMKNYIFHCTQDQPPSKIKAGSIVQSFNLGKLCNQVELISIHGKAEVTNPYGMKSG